MIAIKIPLVHATYKGDAISCSIPAIKFCNHVLKEFVAFFF